jgi:hypothetical protein
LDVKWMPFGYQTGLELCRIGRSVAPAVSPGGRVF